jgi:hypothetical protein
VTVNVVSGSPPDTPTNLKATAISATEIDLSFSEADSGQTGFTIQRSSDPSFVNATRLFTINRPDAVTYDDFGLTPNAAYYYRVQAFSLAGPSDFSNVAGASTAGFNPPIGSIDMPGPAAVAGWAIDPDTPAGQVTVQLLVDGQPFGTVLANLPRSDVAVRFGSANHGYSFDVSSLSPGIHRVDLLALDTTSAQPKEITARTIDTNRLPGGSLDMFRGTTFAGWAADPNAPSASIRIEYILDSNAPVFVTADVARSDLLPTVGSANHGFLVTLPPLTAGTHTVQVFAVDPTTDETVSLGRRASVVAGAAAGVLPMGNIDQASVGNIAGWAFNPQSPSESPDVRVDVDGVIGQPVPADLARPDVAARLHVATNLGFVQPLSLAAGEHRIDVFILDPNNGPATLLGSRIVVTPGPAVAPIGSIDMATPDLLAGWAWSPAAGAGPVTVRLDIDGLVQTAFQTAIDRPDVDAKFGSGTFGFSVTPPKLAPGVHTVRLVIIDALTLQESAVASSPLTTT